MGTIHHHAMILTSYKEDAVRQAHAEAFRLGMTISDVVASPANGYSSFAVFPDGSKEWWDDSNIGNQRRKELQSWIDGDAYEGGDHHIEYVIVSFGELEATIETNCK